MEKAIAREICFCRPLKKAEDDDDAEDEKDWEEALNIPRSAFDYRAPSCIIPSAFLRKADLSR